MTGEDGVYNHPPESIVCLSVIDTFIYMFYL